MQIWKVYKYDTERDEISYNTISNDTQSTWTRLALMIHRKKKKGKLVHVFESLARLAYNKGTALFRGNDPLRKKCCGNILRDHPHHHHHALTDTSTCSTQLQQEWKKKHGEASGRAVHVNQRLESEKQFVSHWNQTEANMRFESVTVKLYFLTSCWINWIEGQSSREGFGPEPKERGEESGLQTIRKTSRTENLRGHHAWRQAVRNNRTSLTKDQSVGSTRIWDFTSSG